MDKQWIRDRRFPSLSIKDLLEAREAYHVHLAHLENVFATAIGRYLIRPQDSDYAGAQRPSDWKAARQARTLDNGEVRPWSWPCILVFVDKWQPKAAFAEAPDTMVPRFLYMPDGRVVPTCVVYAARDPAPRPRATPTFPSDLLGGGAPALQDVQGQLRLSTVGCLVTDGDLVFALTNRHVAGEEGRRIHTVVHGARQKIGRSAGRNIAKTPFSVAYPGWPGARVALNMDVGLVELRTLQNWTAQVYGVGEIGPIWDLNVDSFNLDIIDCPALAHGAAGGDLKGRIRALFFRYKTVGGVEYVSDFLIGPAAGAATTGSLPGDSGALWFADRGEPGEPKRPFAIQWGGESLISPGAEVGGAFVLATCLATACRELDVEVIADWNTGHPETWGPVGHFKVGALACELVQPAWLKTLFMTNQRNIGVGDDAIDGSLEFADKDVPLADVPDYVWRTIRKMDDDNHFADVDRRAPAGAPAPFGGKTLLELTRNKPDQVHPDIWNAFYKASGEKRPGGMPFRVWQIFDEMVGFADKGDLTKFICAAGLMAHYVGDGGQPLHGSELHHGHNKAEKGVHSAYETAMLNAATDLMIAAVAKAGAHWPAQGAPPATGQQAAVEVVELLRRTAKRLPPETIIASFNAHHRGKKMWEDVGAASAKCIYDASLTLARIWQGAWEAGRAGKAAPAQPAAAISRSALAALYMNEAFLKSYKIPQLTEKNGRLVPKAP